jgi:hypothetical protein
VNAKQINEIKSIVDKSGWQAVRSHSELGPLWAKHLSDSKTYTDKVIDR